MTSGPADRSVASSSWTTPSHMSLLTGLSPTRHGVTGSDRGLREALRGERPIERLPEAITTLAEALAGAQPVGVFLPGDDEAGPGHALDLDPVRIAAPFPRLVGWTSTAQPSWRAASAVPSVEPSSTTRMR